MQMTRSVARISSPVVAGITVFIVAVFGSAILPAQVTPAATPSTAVAVLAAATPAPAPVPVVDVDASNTVSDVRLVVGRSTLIDVGAPIARVSLTSADIADALVTTPSQLLVHGRTPGSISMFVWSRAGAVRRYEIAVHRDVAHLVSQIKELFPNEKIEVHSNGRNVILSGTVATKDVADRAVNVAAGSVEKKEDVVTLLQVREARPSNQVLLRVRFAEVNRSAMTEFGMSLFTSPTGVKNTLGRVTTQQFPAPGYTDLEWSMASSDFGADVPSAKG